MNNEISNEKLHLSDVMFSIFTLDEIKTIIKPIPMSKHTSPKVLLWLSRKNTFHEGNCFMYLDR